MLARRAGGLAALGILLTTGTVGAQQPASLADASLEELMNLKATSEERKTWLLRTRSRTASSSRSGSGWRSHGQNLFGNPHREVLSFNGTSPIPQTGNIKLAWQF